MKALGLEMLGRVPTAEGDLCLAVVGPDAVTSPALDAVRRALVARLDLPADTAHAFCWIVDFPLFELDPGTGEPVPAHHPFTAPHPDDLDQLTSSAATCRSTHYDVVYNGHELGSGSIRITDQNLQRTIFNLLGLSPEEIERRFGLVRGEGMSCAFDQKQVQEVLYGGLLPELRSEYHTLLAEAYAQRCGETPSGADAVFRAHHHLSGSRPQEARPPLEAALDHLARGFRNERLLDMARRGLATQGLLEGAERAHLIEEVSGQKRPMPLCTR